MITKYGIDFYLGRLVNLIVCVLLISGYSSTSTADIEEGYSRVALLYPTVNRQYSGMFDQLIEGIVSVKGYDFVIKRVDEETSLNQLRAWAKENEIRGYIALGQQSYHLAEALNKDLPLIAGGMVATPPGVTGISLTADPEAFFRQLEVINPNIRRVYFIYSERNNGWIVNHGKETSRQFGIEFVPLKATDVRDAIKQYQTVFSRMKPDNEAILIPLDNVAPMDFLMPRILSSAWHSRITVLSNNLSHAKRGVLFSLYPDPYRQGRRLVALLGLRISRMNGPAILLPSVNLKTAVNIRTASHLNLKFSRELIEQFDQVYPAFE